MGEITDALRRAKQEREARRDAEPEAGSGAPSSQSTIVRAGLEAPPRVARPVPSRAPLSEAIPERVPEAIPLRDERDEDVDFAEISQERSTAWPARAVLLEPRKPYTERFRRFAVRVRQELQSRETRTVLITSALRSEGKTFTACNLALALASMSAGGRTALLELDARRPAIAAALGVEPQLGLEDVLAGMAPLAAARTPTDLPSLDLYLIRHAPATPHELIAGANLSGIFEELEKRYDAIVVDSPPILLVPDVSLVLAHVRTCIAVLRAGSTRLRSVRDLLDQLPAEKLIGAFVNDVSIPRNVDQYGYYSAPGESQ